MSRWELRVDHDLCIGSGMCVGTAPEAFALVDGQSVPLAGQIDPDDDALASAESCPVEAILIREIDTGKVIAPEE